MKKQKAVPKKAAATTPTKPAKGAKSKASKKKAAEEEAAEEEEEEAVAAQKEEAEEQEEAKGEADEVEEGDEVDEKTQALVQKLDSADEQEADEGAGKENLGTYKKGQAVGKAPKVAALVKKNPSEPVEGENRGTIYVGHVPFGCVFFLLSFSSSTYLSHIHLCTPKVCGFLQRKINWLTCSSLVSLNTR